MTYIGPIEHGVPVPKQNRKPSPFIAQLSLCKVGDSFVTDINYTHAHNYAARYNMAVRTAYESPGRIRVWKLKDKTK